MKKTYENRKAPTLKEIDGMWLSDRMKNVAEALCMDTSAVIMMEKGKDGWYLGPRYGKKAFFELDCHLTDEALYGIERRVLENDNQ